LPQETERKKKGFTKKVHRWNTKETTVALLPGRKYLSAEVDGSGRAGEPLLMDPRKKRTLRYIEGGWTLLRGTQSECDFGIGASPGGGGYKERPGRAAIQQPAEERSLMQRFLKRMYLSDQKKGSRRGRRSDPENLREKPWHPDRFRG